MLSIRSAQIATLGAVREDSLVTDMTVRLLRQFPGIEPRGGDKRLKETVGSTLDLGRGYGLESRAALWRFLSLAATFGWDFDRLPHLAWMREMLTDADVSTPDERVRLLVDECLHRERVEEHNRRLRTSL